jgi:branched-chain amino acid aminotransferase
MGREAIAIEASDQAWFNGKLVPREKAAPSIASNSFHMATGVFDGLMAYWNTDHYYLHCAKEHLIRFKKGCEHMDLAFTWSPEDLETGIRALLNTCPARTHYIRPICFRGGVSVPSITWLNLNIPVDVCLFGVPVQRDQLTTLNCQISRIERVSARSMPVQWKSCGVYVNSFLAQHYAEQDGFDAAILLDRRGLLAEASTSNLFFIRGNTLVTPIITDDIFPGITRRVVLEIATELGVPAFERDIHPSELPLFSAAFLCATLMEIKPISRIGEQVYSTIKHPIFVEIVQRFREVTHQ